MLTFQHLKGKLVNHNTFNAACGKMSYHVLPGDANVRSHSKYTEALHVDIAGSNRATLRIGTHHDVEHQAFND